MKIKTRVIHAADVEGETLVSNFPISFYGDIDKRSGMVINPKSDIYGESLKDKILIFPYTVGSTVGSWVIYALKKNNLAPLAMIVDKADMILASGCIISNIPLFDKPELNVRSIIKSGSRIRIEGGYIILEK